MNDSKKISCRDCKFANEEVITTGLKDNYSNWLCTHNGKKMVIKLSHLNSKELNAPLWCPLGKMISLGKSEQKEVNKEEKKSLTTIEKYNKLRSLKPLMEWDNIKENSVYHIPPLFYNERTDILVLKKDDISFTYKVLSKNPYYSSSIVRTMYKTMSIAKFLTKHKIQDIHLVTNPTI